MIQAIEQSIEVQLAQKIADRLAQHGMIESLDLIKVTTPATLDTTRATVVRTYIAEYEIEDLDQARISIIPHRPRKRRIARKFIMEMIDILVVIAKRYQSQADRSDLTKTGDEILKLAEEISFFFECPENKRIEVEECCIEANFMETQRELYWETPKEGDTNVQFSQQRLIWSLVRAECEPCAPCGDPC